MSLRDYFAGQALAGISQHLSVMLSEQDMTAEEIRRSLKLASALSLSLADEMMEARTQEEETEE
tara:strand:+ start:763 stop:954 length:192 start_codon:yes stop_codon:yes gene_type:complete